MKKSVLSLVLFLFSFFLVGCELTTNVVRLIDEKKDIVEKKYGEVEYIVENIIIYKAEKEEFESIKGVDYIISRSGNSGSVSPYLAKNFYLLMDIVKQEGEYKLLLYNNIMKSFSNKEKMFVMANYFLPININELTTRLKALGIEQGLRGFEVSLNKKDSNQDNGLIDQGLRSAYYNKIKEGTFYITFYNNITGDIVIGTTYDYWIGNDRNKEVYYPKNRSYQNIIDEVYDTLNDEKIAFSLNKGLDYQLVSNKLEEFEIWVEQINDEVKGKIFFSAYTYEEFLININEIIDLDIYEYNYHYREDFDRIVDNYDESYFDENILLFYYKLESNISLNYVYSVTIKEDTLTLNVNRFEGNATALSSWLEVVTIKKEDIKSITKIDIIVRTISQLADSVYIYIDSEFAREFYVNPNALNDFKDLENIEDVFLFNWSLNVDLKFNVTATEDDVLAVVNYLENNPNVKSVGYKGKDFIRVQMNHAFYDKVVNKTLLISDFIGDEELINRYEFTISILDFTPFATITFVLKNKGIENAAILVRALKKRNYPYLNSQWTYLDNNA